MRLCWIATVAFTGARIGAAEVSAPPVDAPPLKSFLRLFTTAQPPATPAVRLAPGLVAPLPELPSKCDAIVVPADLAAEDAHRPGQNEPERHAPPGFSLDITATRDGYRSSSGASAAPDRAR